MASEDFFLNLSPLPSPRWSPLRLTPSPPRPFLPSSTVMQYQGCNQSMDNPPQNQEHEDIVDLPQYLAGDSALLQQQLRKNNQGFEELNMGFEEESEEEMMTCFYFPPSPTYFPLYRPMPTVFFVSTSNIQDISLALSYQHLLEDKSGALHVLNGVERTHIVDLLFDGCKSYVVNKFGDLYQTARAAGLVPEVVVSLVHKVVECIDEREVTLRRINWSEQHDEYIVEQPVFEMVDVTQQLIQNRGGELDVIFGGGVSMINGLECRESQGSPTTPETLLICPFKYSTRVWLGHGGQWAAEARCRCNRLNIGSFTAVDDAISAYELVGRLRGWMDLTGFLGLFENGNRSKLPPQLPPTTQEAKQGGDFGLVRCNATGNDENEAVGTGSERTGECVMADQARLNSVCLGEGKTKEKTPGGEKRNKKTNGVRTAIPLKNILQTRGMHRKDAAKHLKVSITKLKSSCRKYGIQRWPPRNEHKLIRQSLTNANPAVVDQEGIPHLTSDTMPSNQALTAVVDTNNFFEKEILLPQRLPTAQQDNPDVGFGNDEDEAIGMEVTGTVEGVLVDAQLYSRCLEKKGKRKVNTPRGERGNNITTRVRIAITMEDLLKVKEMPLTGAAEHLEVSRSTLKRACREYGIKRWPPCKEHKLISQTCPNESPAVEHEHISRTRPNESPAVKHELINQTRPNESPAVEHELINQTRPNESPVVVDQEQTPQLNSDMFLPSNQDSATTDTKSVMFKARYEEVTIKFRLSQPFRKIELEQEVKKRLSLEAGIYNINYKDEDDDLVLIACDEDLEECISSSSPLGSGCHELFLKPK